MEKLSNSSHFLDLAGLDSLRAQAQKDEKGALKEAAKQFEGIFIQMLMKSMRDANAAFKSDSPLNSQTTEFFEQMRDQQMSVDLSNKGMLGLAELMVQQLDPGSSPVKPASMLRNDYDGKAVSSVPTPAMLTMPSQADMADVTQLLAGDNIAIPHQAFANTATTAEMTQDLDRILSGQVSANAAGKSLPSQAQQAAVNVEQFQSPEHFVSVLYPHAEKAAKSLGTTPEVLIAQSALETGWGQKMVRKPGGDMSHNLFNIKADRRWQGDKASVSTLEYEQGIAVRQKADFRVYDSIEQSFNDFVSFIENSDRYQQAKKVAATPALFMQELQRAGYATDPQYANKVMKVMNSVSESLHTLMPKGTN